jgi:hypothetical protein
MLLITKVSVAVAVRTPAPVRPAIVDRPVSSEIVGFPAAPVGSAIDRPDPTAMLLLVKVSVPV